jgi:hypothetical protein
MKTRDYVACAIRWMRGACLAVTTVLAFGVSNAWATDADIVNADGFEPHAPPNGFSTTFLGTGQLEGQVNPPGFAQVLSPGQWLKTTGGSSTAVVQSAVFAPGGGNQAVKVDRGAGSFDRWAVPVNNQGYPDYPNPAPPEPPQPYICISWDMRVAGTGSASALGPFFGIEANDDDGNPVGLLGSLGVDATTGDVLYQAENTGFLTETGSVVAFDTWHNYAIELNYALHRYSFFLDGALLGSQAFVDQNNIPGGLNQFSDADIAALAAGGDAASLALTGTAYFDNFRVMEGQCIPEPTTWVLGMLGAASVSSLRRGRRS